MKFRFVLVFIVFYMSCSSDNHRFRGADNSLLENEGNEEAIDSPDYEGDSNIQEEDPIDKYQPGDGIEWDNKYWVVDKKKFDHPFIEFDGPAGTGTYNGELYMIGGNNTRYDGKYGQWQLWKGSDIDHLKKQPQPQMKSSFPYYTTDAVEGQEEWCFYWPMGLYIDQKEGTFYSINHIEYNFKNGWNSEAKERRMGIMKSDDLGKSWSYIGDILTQDKSSPAPDDHEFNGVGDASFLVDSASGYAYLFYKRGFYDKTTLWRDMTEICIARCPIADIADPAKWKKFYNDAWDEPGIDGHATVLLEENGTINVTYNEYLKKYVLIGRQNNEKKFIQFSEDLSTGAWTEKEYLVPDELETWYKWCINPETGSTQIIGREFRYYTSGLDAAGKRIGYYHKIIFK